MILNPESMTIEQKIGMVLCARRFEKDDVEFIKELLKNHSLGAIQFPAWEPELIEDVLSVADYPVLVINDTETGFPTTDLPMVPLISLAATDKKEYFEAYAKGIIRDGKKIGFNGTWGPVIDVLHFDGPCSVHRKFSDDPMKVAKYAEIIAKVFKDNHYLTCGKHFPGGWDAWPMDTHMTEGVSHCTKEDLINSSLVPYKYLLEKDLLPTAMVGHTVYTNIDPDYPASISKKVLDIIREIGFDGVMFTDSFAMMGILQKYGEENIYGMAMNAGIDIILPNYRTGVKEVYDMLMKNYKDGAFNEERLNEAVRRVLKAQEFVGTKPENPDEFTKEDEELLYAVARDCITAVTDEGVSVKLDGEDKDKLFVIVSKTETIDDKGAEVSFGQWYDEKRIVERIEKVFPDSSIELIPEFSSWLDNERVLLAATKHKEVIFITHCTTGPYLGTDCLTRRIESVVNALIRSEKISAIVHFGNPFALKNLFPVKRKLFGYHIPQSQEYAIDVLKGTIEAKGKLPFEI